MGQDEVIDFLEKSEKPVCRRQIAEALKESPIKISHIVQRLIQTNQIKCVEFDRRQTAKALGLDRPLRRTRFYYL